MVPQTYTHLILWLGKPNDRLDYSKILNRPCFILGSMSKLKAQSHPSASTQRSHLDRDGNKGGPAMENTYKLDPDDNFPSAPIRKIISDILQVTSRMYQSVVKHHPGVVAEYFVHFSIHGCLFLPEGKSCT